MPEATSNEIWILAADARMAAALEVPRWVELFAEHGVAIVPHTVSELRFIARTGELALTDLAGTPVVPPRFCLARVYGRHAPRHLELMGTRCLPSAALVDLTHDKALVSQLVAGSGVPMIEAELIDAFDADFAAQALDGKRFLPHHAVLKPASGRGGTGVLLARNLPELADSLDDLHGLAGLVQPEVDPGRDVRVYVIGGEPRYAMERIGAPGDFRSNYSTGGTARPYALTPELASYARRVLAALSEPLLFGSVDFCFAGGAPVFCELNANLGCHIPYEFGNLDLIGDYADWLRDNLLA